MANNNLFYSLYSNSNNKVSAPYKCSNMLDEEDTSFDISGSNGVITDSNGNTLASLDLSMIHVSPVLLYNVETRIILPYSTYLLQGQEYGYAYTSYYFPIIELITLFDGYERYCNVSFDIFCDDIMGIGYHVEITANGLDSFTTLINDDFTKNNINVTTSLLVLTDPITNKTREYLVFLALATSYFYYIRNLRIDPILASVLFPDSPFSNDLDNIRGIIYDLLILIHPMLPGIEYSPDTYEIDCDLYKWILENYEEALKELSYFKNAIDFLLLITEESNEDDVNKLIDKANLNIINTVFDNDVITKYDDNNMELIYTVLLSLLTVINEHSIPSHVWLREDILKRIPIMKYPNGAFKGIVLIPEWPVNTDEYEYASLWIHHIKDTATILTEAKVTNLENSVSGIDLYGKQDILYRKHEVGVIANATLINELKEYNCECSHDNITDCSCNNVQTNLPTVTVIEDGYEDNCGDEDHIFSDHYDGPFKEDKPIEQTIFMGRSYYSNKSSVIGLYRYLQYVSQENLWVKMGHGYMVLGKNDDPQEKTKNLPSSLLLYNPNPIPIRIKYMIFS